jgi:hypothetical protein
MQDGMTIVGLGFIVVFFAGLVGYLIKIFLNRGKSIL